MIYLINDVVHGSIITPTIKTIKVAKSEEEVLKYLSDSNNLKKFKGELRIEKVVL